ncbi:hypothetical protein SRHO_G00098920 [Serrasalmus rhombeus]
MEIVERETVNVANSVLVNGLTETEADSDLSSYLEQYGPISRVLRIDDPTSTFHKHAIVEFKCSSAMDTLRPLLPYTYPSPSKDVAYHLKALARVYVPPAAGRATHCFLDELRKLAAQSNKSFSELLQEHLSLCHESILADEARDHTGKEDVETECEGDVPVINQTCPPQTYRNPTMTDSRRFTTTDPVIALGDVNPPAVQRVVVEHIVRSEEAASHTNVAARLRTFSGKTPHPNSEVDYDSWRNNVELLLNDPSLSDLHRSRKILDSLLPPAANLVKHLGPLATPKAYLDLLDSAFATVEEGDELFAKFLNTLQDASERPSEYLQRLHAVMSRVTKQGVIPATEADKHLLRQFCRGCWDNGLIADLQLEQKKNRPPTFSEFLLLLRIEEEKHTAKEQRMKKHLGNGRHRVSSHVIQAENCDAEVKEDPLTAMVKGLKKQMGELQGQIKALKPQRTSDSPEDTSDLKTQIVQLQSQITRLQASNSQKSKVEHSGEKTKRVAKTVSHETQASASKPLCGKPRPWYCFCCGEDGHIATLCNADPNPSLVAVKRKQLREKQQAWELEHFPQTSFKLTSVSVEGQTETVQRRRPYPNRSLVDSKAARATYHKQLPSRLVGTKCTSNVTINGRSYNCLLDTGSQVTTIPQSFYETYLPHAECKPLNDLLEVEAANGQLVPYSGYIELNITFPESFLGTSIEVPTLALVVPDKCGSAQSPLLIGTNTLDALYEKYCEECSANYQSQHHGYKMVLKTLEVRHKQTEDSKVSDVRLCSEEPQVIPAHQSLVLDGSVTTRGPEKQFVLQQPTTSLPGGLIVTSSLLTLPNKPQTKLPVMLKNESNHDIILTPKRVIAELHAVQQVLPSAPSTGSSVPNPPSPVPNSGVQFDFADSPIPEEWKERVTCKLNAIPEVFAQHDLDFGHSSKVRHHIRLSDETPFKQRARPIHPQDINAVRRHLEELLEAGVIRESESSFSSPIVVVRKKNGDVRLCVDYRKLNLQTVKDAYALPNLEETFSVLTGSQWFSVLDLKSGYYQIELNEADKHKTAFVCPLGFWEFNRLPQGITNAPSTFQRLMEKCMSDLNLKEVIVFLDDLIVFSATLEEHEHRLLRVLQRLKEYGLKLSPEKCKFFQTSVRYLGHIVSRNGVETDPEKIEALKNWPNPKNLKELRSFLGFAGYYRRFIQDFSKIVKPLNDLTAGYGPVRKKCKVGNRDTLYYKPKEPFGSRWTESCKEAFDTIINKLTSAPVLAYANPKLPYILHTDASTTGLGAALYQEQDGQIRAIAFASRGLSCSESRYPAHKLEFLALKWAVTEKFSDYLYGNSFTVITDSNPLTYILTSAKLDATSYRWLSALSTFSFKLQYRPGKHNLDADALSRLPHNTGIDDPTSQKEQDRIRQFTLQHLPEFYHDIRVGPEVVQAICEARLVRQPSGSASESSSIPLVESLASHPDSLPDGFVQGEHFKGFPIFSKLSEAEVCEKQKSDSVIREVISSLEGGGVPSPSAKKEIPQLHLMCREWNRLLLRNGILYRKRQDGQEVQYQLVLPEEWREMVMTSLHDDMGHLGVERTLDLVRSRFYWPRMATDIGNKIRTCRRCVLRKAPLERAAPLVNIRATRPLELVCMDFLSIEPDRSNTKDVLVITDFFTKYAVAVPTPNQKARTVAKCLWENFIVYYGIPERLHSDQGPDFESKTIKELCEVIGTRKVRTTPYHPRGNPVERFNRTLLSMIGTLKEEQKSHWHDFVKPLVHAYNCTKHESTGFTPYELMFGRKPRLPIDLAFDVTLDHQEGISHSQYVQHLKTQLEESYKLAMENAAKLAEKNKTRFDRRVTESILEKNDRVLVRNVKLRGKHKLADRWESTVYVVVERIGELPVYKVRPENQEGPVRTLHRDLLRPCNFLSIPDEDPPKAKAKRPRTRSVLHRSDSEPCSDLDDYPVHYYTGPLRRIAGGTFVTAAHDSRVAAAVARLASVEHPDWSWPVFEGMKNSDRDLPRGYQNPSRAEDGMASHGPTELFMSLKP